MSSCHDAFIMPHITAKRGMFGLVDMLIGSLRIHANAVITYGSRADPDVEDSDVYYREIGYRYGFIFLIKEFLYDHGFGPEIYDAYKHQSDEKEED